MIRRSPAEYYFKYLVVHPQCYDDAFIKNVARELGIDHLGPWYVTWLREGLRPPSPFYPEDARHVKSQRFLLREGLERVFNPTKDMDQALRILSRPRWREVVETMLLSRAPLEAVVHALRVRHKASVSEEAVRLFKHYFWNIDLLDSVEMRALLDMRHHGLLADDDAAVQKQYGSIKRMRHSDPRVVAARLPTSPLTAALAQMELGVLPKRVDLASVIERTMEVAALRTFEAAAIGGPQGAQMGQGFALIFDVMNRLKSTIVNPEDKLREDLKKISLATTPREVPTLSQLTDGKHTTNVHPEPKAETVLEAEFTDGDGVDDDSED